MPAPIIGPDKGKILPGVSCQVDIDGLKESASVARMGRDMRELLLRADVEGIRRTPAPPVERARCP